MCIPIHFFFPAINKIPSNEDLHSTPSKASVSPTDAGKLSVATTIPGELTSALRVDSEDTEDDTKYGHLVPQVFTLLLQFASYGYQPPSYGRLQTRPYNTKGSGMGLSGSMVS